MSAFDILNFIEWRQPLWLFLILQPLLLWLVIRWKSNKSKNQFADKHLLPWVQANNQKSFLQRLFSRDTAYWLGMILLAIAMAGPQTPLDSADAKQAPALDIMLLVDVSASMKSSDIKPSRLQRGVQELYEFLNRINRDDVHFGSIVYAARPHVFVPITSDLDALKFYLKDLGKLVLPTKGSDASSALLMAGKQLKATTNRNATNSEKQAKAIVWLTDGDFANAQDKVQIEATIKSLKNQNIPTFILGLGTAEGSAIPLRKGGWLEHKGQGVISKMDEGLLDDFAKSGGGKFSKTYDDERDWKHLYDQGLLNIVSSNPKASSENVDQQWVVYYQWPLFVGLTLLLFSLVPFGFYKSNVNRNKAKHSLSIFFGAILISALLSPTAKLYAKEPVIGVALQESIKSYNKKEYALATSGFMAVILDAKTNSERARAMHNLGNNYFQQGDYKNAKQLYEDALLYMPNQTATKNNLALTSELNALLQRRQQRAAARRVRTSNRNGPLGNRKPSSGETSRVSQIKNPKLPELPKGRLNDLLNKGLAHLKILESVEVEKEKKKQRTIEQARISLLSDQDNSLAMWKRLFEIEEGFPAKLEESKIVPGVMPW
jgi:Ca-activated chloride channel family protein